MPDGRIDVRFALLDDVKQTQLAGFSYVVPQAQLRATAHKIADVIYEKLTGDLGVFSTRIAYIAKQGRRFELFVAEADGFGAQSVVASNEPLLSPAWSPDGTRIAYVSMENRKPVVYVQSLASGQRQVVANFRGSNSAPAWSPDGSRLAVTLTKDGGSQIYVINADGSGVQRLIASSNSNAIDTEANFSPDGKSILFTSDRGGSPQIYRYTMGSGQVERMTYEGSYNVSPRHLPDGKGFVYVRRDGGRFNVAVQDFAARQSQVLTQGIGRRIAQRRPERQDDHLRIRGRVAWYIGRGLERWPGQAETDRSRHRRARTRMGPPSKDELIAARSHGSSMRAACVASGSP